MIRLVLGGQKSGKSDHALELLRQAPEPRLFVATGRARDAAFRAQIAAHRASREKDLPVCEPGLDLAGALDRALGQGGAALVDSLDFWLFSCRQAGNGSAAAATAALLEVLSGLREQQAPEVIIVSTESGLGALPAEAAARDFYRALGALNQSVAALALDVRLVVAGLPFRLKGGPA